MDTIEKLAYLKAIMFLSKLPPIKLEEVNKLLDEVVKEVVHDTMRKIVYLQMPDPIQLHSLKRYEEVATKYHTFYYANKDLIISTLDDYSINDILKRNNDVLNEFYNKKND
jgi:hypothetical protein